MTNYDSYVGYISKDPEIRYTQGTPEKPSIKILKFDIHLGNKKYVKCVFWRSPDSLDVSLKKGDRVIVNGFSSNKEYTNRNGDKVEYEELNTFSVDKISQSFVGSNNNKNNEDLPF